MSDVEKYGLVAVVFVGGLLLVIAAQGGFGGDEASALAPELIDSAAPLRSGAPTANAAGSSTVRVVSVLPDTPFHWDEPPVPYPGRRSASPTPGASEAISEVGALSTPPLAGPKIASGAAAGAPRKSSGTHVIAKGETLSDIADQYLGSTTRWKELVALNPGLDPKKLKIGQVLRVAPGAATAASPASALAAQPEAPVSAPGSAPPVVAATLAKPAASGTTAAKSSPASKSAKSRTHTVAKGDTLGAIAKRYLGSTARADDLYQANTDVLKSKDALAVGQVLRIP